MKPTYILNHSDVGRQIRVSIQTVNMSDKSRGIASNNSPVIQEFVGSSGPLLQFINGLPDPSLSSSTSSIFEYLVTTDSAVTISIIADGAAQPVAFKQGRLKGNNAGKIQLKNLKPGDHSIQIKATSAAGTKEISYSWKTQPIPSPDPCTNCKWKPKVSETWDWQLHVPVDNSFVRDVYDIDGLLNAKAVVTSLKAKTGTDGKPRRVIGYIEAGTLSTWRSDASSFPASILGRPYDPPYTDERWLDFRQLSVILPLMEKRLNQLVANGFDAVEYDNVDGWDIQMYQTSFPLTYEDGLAFTAALANLARSKGLRVSHKNNVDQVVDNLPYVDFAVSEQCYEYNECQKLFPFITAGKPVFSVEYQPYNPRNNVCSLARSQNIRTLYKTPDLDAYGVSCDLLPRGSARMLRQHRRN